MIQTEVHLHLNMERKGWKLDGAKNEDCYEERNLEVYNLLHSR